MKQLLVAMGLAAGLTFASYVAFSPASHAGWGPPFAPGAGANTGNINWDNGIATPGAKAPVLTGVLADDSAAAKAEEEFTVEELENGKPLFIYYFVDGLTDAGEDSYKLAQSFEVKVLAKEKIVDQINANWRAKKVGLDLDGDRKKDAANRGRMEFWSFTGVKMGEITDTDRVSSRSITTKLSSFESKNKMLNGKEIKRLQSDAKKSAAK